MDQEVPFVRPGRDEAYFAKGRPARHRFAVLYQGEYETLWDGTAVAVRAHARALDQAGISVFLKSFSGIVVDEHGVAQPVHSAGIPEAVKKEVGHLEHNTASVFFPIIKHAVIQDAAHLKKLIVPPVALGNTFEEDTALRAHLFASTIVYSVWERDRVDPGIVKTLNRVGECWVPCSDNRQMLIRSGVEPEKVVVVPHPYDPDTEIRKLRRRMPDASWKKFYSIGRWEPRKGYAELIEAFLLAFTPADNAILTIKYTGGAWQDYPTPAETLERCRRHTGIIRNRWTPERIQERVKLHEGRFPRSQILRMHYFNNIYVAPSHGEAWCLPAFEAMLAGNGLVYTPTGGVPDFAGGDFLSPVELSDPAPVPRSYNWESDARWAGFTVPALVEALRRAKAPTTHASHDLTEFSMASVGALMRERVLRVAAIRPDARDFYLREDRD